MYAVTKRRDRAVWIASSLVAILGLAGWCVPALGQSNGQQTLEFSNLGFAIPEGATIRGFWVHVEGYGNNASCPDCFPDGEVRIEADLQLVTDGAVATGTRTATIYGLNPNYDIGGPTDLWGVSWTPEQVNAPSFGVRFSVNLQLRQFVYQSPCDCDGSAWAFIDAVEVNVFYNPPGPPAPIDWSMGVPANDARFVIAPTPDLSNPAVAVASNGTITCTNLVETSSRRFKSDIRPLQNALEKVARLEGVSYPLDEGHGRGRDIGFIAEDVGKVVPEIVAYEPDGVRASGVKYDRIGALTVEAIKELHALVEQRDARLASQQERISRLEAELAEIRLQMQAASNQPN